MLVTIASQTHTDWSLDPTIPVEIRVFALQAFIASDGTPISASPANPGVNTRVGWSVAGVCTVTPPASTAPVDSPSTLVVPSLVVHSTTDAIENIGAQLAAYLFRIDTGVSLGPYSVFASFLVPSGTASLTWSAIALAQGTGFANQPGVAAAISTLATTGPITAGGLATLSAGAVVIGGTTTDKLTVSTGSALSGGATVAGGLTVDSITGPQFVQLAYPNTDGLVFQVADSKNSPVFGVTESGGIFTPGALSFANGVTVTGSTSTSTLAVTAAATVGGALNVGGAAQLTSGVLVTGGLVADTISGGQLAQIPYPNTEGIIFQVEDSNNAPVFGVTESGGIFTAGSLSFSSGIAVGGSESVAGTLSVMGAGTFNNGVSVTGGLVADTISGGQLTQIPYPNTEGFLFAVTDKNGATIFGVNESLAVYSPGSTPLPTGTTVSAANALALPGDLTVAGNFYLSGLLNASQLLELPYPNTEGIIIGFIDASGHVVAWFDETGTFTDLATSLTIPQVPTVIIADFTPLNIPATSIYQTTDSSGNAQIASQTAVKGALAHTPAVETVLTSAGKNFAPTVNSDGTISFITSRTGRNRRYKMNPDGTSQFYEELQLRAALFASNAPTYHHVLMTGQSLSVGAQAYPVLTTSQPFANKMFSGPGGVNAVTNGVSGVTLVPLVENCSQGPDETMANGFADGVTSTVRAIISDNPSGPTSYDLIVSNSGISAQPYLAICGPTDAPPGGTPSYKEMMSQVTLARSLIGAAVYFVPVVIVIHGESDDNSSAGPLYYQHLSTWQSDIQTGIQSITGQTGIIPFLLGQTCAWAAYSGQTFPRTALAQLQVAMQYPSKFILATPEYYLPHANASGNGSSIPDTPVDSYGSGGAHLTADGQRWMGCQFDKVFRRVFLEGQQWLPLCPIQVTRTGSVIAIDFHVPSGPLVLDTVHVANPGNFGLEYYDDQASVAILSVSLDAVLTKRLNVYLSGVPTGTNKAIRYAYTCAVGPNNNGPGQGPRGCLRDSDPAISYYNSSVTLNALTAGQPYPLWNWCTTFSEPLA